MQAESLPEKGLALVQAQEALGSRAFQEILDSRTFGLDGSDVAELVRLVGDKLVASLAGQIMSELSNRPAVERVRAAGLLFTLADKLRGVPPLKSGGTLI